MTPPTQPEVSAERREQVVSLLKSHDLYVNDWRTGPTVIGPAEKFWLFIIALDAQAKAEANARVANMLEGAQRNAKLFMAATDASINATLESAARIIEAIAADLDDGAALEALHEAAERVRAMSIEGDGR